MTGDGKKDHHHIRQYWQSGDTFCDSAGRSQTALAPFEPATTGGERERERNRERKRDGYHDGTRSSEVSTLTILHSFFRAFAALFSLH